MEIISKVSGALTSLGASVLIPIFIFIICMVFGAKLKKSLMAGLTFGAAYIGLNLVINLMITTVNPMVTALADNLGVKKDILDVGWAVRPGHLGASDVLRRHRRSFKVRCADHTGITGSQYLNAGNKNDQNIERRHMEFLEPCIYSICSVYRYRESDHRPGGRCSTRSVLSGHG